MPAKIIRCECRHPSQDSLHGEGMRVYCQTMANDKKTWRCSVCRKEKAVGETDAKASKKK